jgi:predicted AAA+ superfamily ATPase
LARDLDISRNVLPDYMSYLEKAGLVNLLREKAQGLKLLEKVEKIYLNNTNLAYALSEQVPDIGSVRETVFLSWMRVVCFVTSSAISDFEIDGRTFEIGGKNKMRQQIKQAADGYVVKDDIEYAFRNMIPLWMFGFIY